MAGVRASALIRGLWTCHFIAEEAKQVITFESVKAQTEEERKTPSREVDTDRPTKADMKRWSNFFYRICLILWFFFLSFAAIKKKSEKGLKLALLWTTVAFSRKCVWCRLNILLYIQFHGIFDSLYKRKDVHSCGWLITSSLGATCYVRFHLYGDISGTVSHTVHSSLIFLFSSL